MIVVKRDEEILFKGIEVAKPLGYSDPSCTLRKHVDDDETINAQGMRYSMQGMSLVHRKCVLPLHTNVCNFYKLLLMRNLLDSKTHTLTCVI